VTSGARAVRGSVVLFVAAMLQGVLVTSLVVGGGAADLLLVVVVALGMLRGSVAGSVYGFFGGLVLDLLTLGTLGLTSLVLTLAGFWAGRYAETTGAGRRLAPFIAVGVITALAGFFAFVLHFLLDEDVVARDALLTALAPMVVLNLALALPVYALVRWAVHERPALESVPEVEVVV
jgi:rod shape-determining protein MreD